MKRKWTDIAGNTLAVMVFAEIFALAAAVVTVCVWGIVSLWRMVSLRPADPEALPADIPTAGIGRTADSTEAGVYLGEWCREDPETAHRIQTYTEWEGVAPEWYRPWEPMAAEWEDHFGEGNKKVTDAGCPDWNVDSTLYGWDGRTMEAWEMDLFARIFYREFWQPNLMLCEAGCDAMLGLWELDGGTMYETLSHINEDGSYSFSTFPGVWESEYDPDGLAWCKAYCEERFYEGPVWPAQYFRKGQYHNWGEWSPIPAYEIDGIYFSMGKER